MDDQRVRFAHLPTPLVPADRLGAAIGLDAGRLWIKHDDLTGLAGGGNKVRKLEYLCADALAHGADTLVTGGGRQSNHVRLTAAASNRVGMDCVAVLSGREEVAATGNVLLDEVLGVELVWSGDLQYAGIEQAITQQCERLAAEGRRPYRIPVGGASAVGALGYVTAVAELVEQAPDISLVVLADGSGGTHAGLATGLGGFEHVLGVDVGTRPDLDEQVPLLADEAAERVGVQAPTGPIRIDHDHWAPGYGDPSEPAREALDLAARSEGVLLDPVYTGKAMAGLITAARQGRLPTTGRIAFLHTGGLPGLFAARYASWVRMGPGSRRAVTDR